MKYNIKGRSIKESFDNLPSGVCFADSKGMIVLCNRQMHRLCCILLGTGLQHIFELREALQTPTDTVTHVEGTNDTFRFPDGRIWEFRESTVTVVGGKTYTQIQALSLTELYAKKTELEQKNRELEEVNKRARKLYAELDNTVREEEAFAIKMRIHSDIGLRLLATHKVLREGGLTELKEAGKIWRSTLNVFGIADAVASDYTNIEKKTSSRSEEMLHNLINSAAGIGLKIILDGNLPEDREQSYLITTAMRECATNTVRHAGGNEMKVRIFEVKSTLVVWIENNGKPPERRVVEGGGLSDLRKRIEKAGGTMRIKSSPTY